MKVGICVGDGFGERWEQYCIDNHIDYKWIDVYKNDVVEQLKDCDVFCGIFPCLS